jgi:hypothetical protein
MELTALKAIAEQRRRPGRPQPLGTRILLSNGRLLSGRFNRINEKTGLVEFTCDRPLEDAQPLRPNVNPGQSWSIDPVAVVAVVTSHAEYVPTKPR